MTRSCDTRGGGLVPPWSTFPQAPRRSRTVGLPPSGAALGSPSVAFPSRAPLQRCPPDTPPRHGLLPRARPGAPAHQVRGLLEQPRAQSPLARARGALARHGVWHPGRGPSPPLQRSSGLLRQSCTRLVSRASPPHQVWAGGGQPRRGAGPARRGLGAACPACVAPAPGGACGACPRCCPHDRGLPRVRHGSARRKARPALAVRRPSRGCRHARLFRPAGVRATPSAPPAPACTVGPPCLFPPSRSRVVTAPCPGDATRRHRAMDGMGTSTP